VYGDRVGPVIRLAVPALLAALLAVGSVSCASDSKLPAAADVLNHKRPPNNEDILHLDAEILAGWLNFANGSIGWAQLIDTDKNRVPDTPFATVMANAEAVRNNPGSTHRQLEDQRDILKRMNEGWGT
jgi:hypothetical protein